MHACNGLITAALLTSTIIADTLCDLYLLLYLDSQTEQVLTSSPPVPYPLPHLKHMPQSLARMPYLPEETLEQILVYCKTIREAFVVSGSIHHARILFPGYPDSEQVPAIGTRSGTLLSASLVSRSFRRISLPLLYESVIVRLPQECDSAVTKLLDMELRYIPDLYLVQYVPVFLQLAIGYLCTL